MREEVHPGVPDTLRPVTGNSFITHPSQNRDEMVGLLTAVATGFVATALSFVIGMGLRLLTDRQIAHLLKTFTVTGGIAAYTTSVGTLSFFIIFLSPLWIGVVLGILYFFLHGPLARRGYLGRLEKWSLEIDEDDDELQAALVLLDAEDVNDVADISADAEDFQENLISAAGIEEHEVPGPEGVYASQE